MCGISVVFVPKCHCKCATKPDWRARARTEITREFRARIAERGPDEQRLVEIELEAGYLFLYGAVLHLRGERLCSQPAEDADGNILLWNGEIFGGAIEVKDEESDTQVLSNYLRLCCEKIKSPAELKKLLAETLQRIEGPFSFVYFHKRTESLWYARDVLGRRSLLVLSNPQISRENDILQANETQTIHAKNESSANNASDGCCHIIDSDTTMELCTPKHQNQVFALSSTALKISNLCLCICDGAQAASSQLHEPNEQEVIKADEVTSFEHTQLCIEDEQGYGSSGKRDITSLSNHKSDRTESLNKSSLHHETCALPERVPKWIELPCKGVYGFGLRRAAVAEAKRETDASLSNNENVDMDVDPSRALVAKKTQNVNARNIDTGCCATNPCGCKENVSAAGSDVHRTTQTQSSAVIGNGKSCVGLGPKTEHLCKKLEEDFPCHWYEKYLEEGKVRPAAASSCTEEHGDDTGSRIRSQLSQKRGCDTSNDSEMKTIDHSDSAHESAIRLLDVLSESVRRRVTTIPPNYTEREGKNAIDGQKMHSVQGSSNHTIRNACGARLGILFSGGVDCSILAALSHLHLPVEEPIDLINVCFHPSQTSPDRLAALAAMTELKQCFPTRPWRLVCVSVPFSEVEAARGKVSSLMKPSQTMMDANIASAFYFAARGRGQCIQTRALATSDGEGVSHALRSQAPNGLKKSFEEADCVSADEREASTLSNGSEEPSFVQSGGDGTKAVGGGVGDLSGATLVDTLFSMSSSTARVETERKSLLQPLKVLSQRVRLSRNGEGIGKECETSTGNDLLCPSHKCIRTVKIGCTFRTCKVCCLKIQRSIHRLTEAQEERNASAEEGAKVALAKLGVDPEVCQAIAHLCNTKRRIRSVDGPKARCFTSDLHIPIQSKSPSVAGLMRKCEAGVRSESQEEQTELSPELVLSPCPVHKMQVKGTVDGRALVGDGSNKIDPSQSKHERRIGPFSSSLAESEHKIAMRDNLIGAIGDVQISKGRSKEGEAPELFTSTARVLLIGIGADELFAGYGRHLTAHRRGGYEGLAAELELDRARIWKRNLGRDDRIVSCWGKEARFPYLDGGVVAQAGRIPMEHLLDPAAGRGVGDKLVLRECGRLLGLNQCTRQPKRAIQFGSRIAQISNHHEFGSHRKGKGRTVVSWESCEGKFD